MKLSPFKIGELVCKVPIIQGGMGIGVSLSSLASAVAREGGVGIISGVQIGFRELDFETNTVEANKRALRKEIKKAKGNSDGGIIGVNFMVAMNNYDEMVKIAVEEGIDLIISGAGLPNNLPKLVEGSKTKIAPIVSSGKAASIICKLWDKRYKCIPDMIIVEGPEAGGHLGFLKEDIIEHKITLENIIVEVIEAIEEYENKYNKEIPIIAGGGIYDGTDIAKYLKLGVAGVQMATRFVTTHECDANIKFKEAYINSTKDKIKIIKSPVGLPGRAIENGFVKQSENSSIIVAKCYNCLKTCNPAKTPYCISKALIEAVKGNIDEGLIFVGSNAYRTDKIISVKELINGLIREVEIITEKSGD